MTRRNLISTALASSVAMPASAADPKPTILQLRWLRMRNSPDGEMARTREFIRDHGMPALTRAGVKNQGAFTCTIGEESPYLLLITEFPSLAAMETMGQQVWTDPEFLRAYAHYAASAARVYEREEVSLLRSFHGFPEIRPPANAESHHHVFEMRRYESTNGVTLARKIRMFHSGEIGIFERLGMKPVFFGETIVGTKMPNLTYMLCYDNLAARERLWSEFASSPEWKKLSSIPEYSDAQIVSNISNWILSPLNFSEIR